MYKPDNSRTCCPQHTIRLDAQAYRPSKAQRRALNQLYWTLCGRPKPARWKGKWGSTGAYDVENHARLVMHDDSSDIVDLSDSSWPPLEAPYDSIPNERIKLSLRRATSTDEKYALFRRYQKHIHREAEDEISSRRGWEQFLVRAPFPDEGDGQDKAHAFFGVYHHEYRCMCQSNEALCVYSLIRQGPIVGRRCA